jgi:hypothetical protein
MRAWMTGCDDDVTVSVDAGAFRVTQPGVPAPSSAFRRYDWPSGDVALRV